MATPEQEAFIKEMQQTKPKDVWLELWEARQILGLKGVETPAVVSEESAPDLTAQEALAKEYIKTPSVFLKNQILGMPINGDWYPFPVHGDVWDLEYMRDDLGIVHFRMAQTE